MNKATLQCSCDFKVIFESRIDDLEEEEVENWAREMGWEKLKDLDWTCPLCMQIVRDERDRERWNG